MKSWLKKWMVVVAVLFASNTVTWAQCAMCRATLENNVSNGDIGIAAGINFGILYLFVTPYLAIGIIAYMWYRTSKKNDARKLDQGPVAG